MFDRADSVLLSIWLATREREQNKPHLTSSPFAERERPTQEPRTRNVDACDYPTFDV